MPIANCNTVLIALGANLAESIPQNARTLTRALAAIAEDIGPVHAVSRFWQTAAFPPGSGPDFVNACARIATTQAPEDILTALHKVEKALGRERIRRWGARSIDLDLLAVDGVIRPDGATLRHWMDLPAARQRVDAPDHLVLPHPRMQDRAFVLVPLAEIAPDWVHPVLDQSVVAMRDALDPAELAALQPLDRM